MPPGIYTRFDRSVFIGGTCFLIWEDKWSSSERRSPLSNILKTGWDLISGSNGKGFQDKQNNGNKTTVKVPSVCLASRWYVNR